MANIDVDTIAELAAAISSSNPGDVIRVAPGIYTQQLSVSNVTKASPFVTIQPLDPEDPPSFRSTANPPWLWSNMKGFIVDRMEFFNTVTVNVTYNGATHAVSGAGRRAWQIKTTTNANLTIKNCLFDGFMNAFEFDGSTGGSVVRNNTVINTRADAMRFYRTHIGTVIRNNWIHSHRVDPNTVHDTEKHPDAIQFAVNDADARSQNCVIERNRIESWWIPNFDGYMQSIFLDGNSTLNPRYTGFTIQDNDIRAGHQHGISIGRCTGTLIDGNRIWRNPLSQGTDPVRIPTITVAASFAGTISNNVTVRALAGTPSQATLVGNVISANSTANPTGWVNLTDFGIEPTSGPPDPDPEQPTQLTIEGSHGRIGAVYDAGVVSGVQKYSGVLIVPTTSPAFHASANRFFRWSTTSGVIPIEGSVTVDNGTTNSAVRIETFTVRSVILNRLVNVAVALPPNYATSGLDYRGLIALPGQSGSYRLFTNMSTQQSNQGASPMIIATPDIDHRDTSVSNGMMGWYVNHSVRDYRALDFMAQEFIPFILDRYRIDPSRLGVTGHSAGAFGASRLFFAAPTRFDSVSGISGGYEDYVNGTYTFIEVALGVRASNIAQYDANSLEQLLTAHSEFVPCRFSAGSGETGLINARTDWVNAISAATAITPVTANVSGATHNDVFQHMAAVMNFHKAQD